MQTNLDTMSTVSASTFARRRVRPAGQYIKLRKNFNVDTVQRFPQKLQSVKEIKINNSIRSNPTPNLSSEHGTKGRWTDSFIVPTSTFPRNSSTIIPAETEISIIGKHPINQKESSDLEKLENLCFEPPHESPNAPVDIEEASSISIGKLFKTESKAKGRNEEEEEDKNKQGKPKGKGNADYKYLEIEEEIKAIDETIEALKQKRKLLARKRRSTFWHDVFNLNLLNMKKGF